MATKEGTTNKKLGTEIVTPHRIAIIVLIRQFKFRETDESLIDIDDALKIKYRRDFAILLLQLLQSPDLTLKELRSILTSTKYTLPQSNIESFDKVLLDLYNNGTGYLLDIVDNLTRVMIYKLHNPSNCFLKKSSVVGYYIRRFIINFDKLNFSEVTILYLAFQKYYEEWQKSCNLIEENNTNIEIISNDLYTDKDQWSRRQAELFIATQAALLSNNEQQALQPKELQKRIINLLKSNRSLSEAHFLSYLNYLRVNEFCGAIDSLYHCFDRSTVLDNKTINDEKCKIYRYSVLNLAMLHHHFGHKKEALASLKEAIKISQAANDNVCLQHALSWLYQLTNVNRDKLIEHSILKSFDLGLSHTISLGLQNFVKYVYTIAWSPIQVFETMTKSDTINCQNNHTDLITNSYAIKSALWAFYGKSEMSILWSQLLFYININNLNPNKSLNGEGFCLAICNIANHLLILGEYPLVHTIIGLAKDRFPNEPNSYIWMLCENLFIFVRALNHENWNEAEAAAQKIMVVDKWEGCLRLAELYLNKNDFIEANKCISIMMDKYLTDDKNQSKIHYYIRAKILLAEIQFATSYPDSIPQGIINLLSDCLIDTTKYNMDYLTALIYLHIAHVQLSLGMYSQAMKVLDRCLLLVLAHGGNLDRARAMLLYVKCYLAYSHFYTEEDRRTAILSAIQVLETVKLNFQKVEAISRVKGVLYLQAQLYDSVNLTNERNTCAMAFRLLSEEHKMKNCCNFLMLL